MASRSPYDRHTAERQGQKTFELVKDKLAMARALMSHPKLLLDEPSMGLSPIMVEMIFDVIRMVLAQGITILLVEQNAKLALEAAHRSYVMESGLIMMNEMRRHAQHPAREGGVSGSGIRSLGEALRNTEQKNG